MKNTFLILLFTIIYSQSFFSQTVNMDNYEIYLGDKLIGKSDFLKNAQNIPTDKSQKLEFRPITDGIKTAYYLNGSIFSKGEIKNQRENGSWEFWHPNGQKAREGNFIDGKQNGTHKYWYDNGQLRGIGNWENGIYEGTWEIYNASGSEKTIQNYKNGKLVE